MSAMKTPGVYIVEKDAFPNSVVGVATAVPAAIGYTQRADDEGKSLKNVPWRITSMAEFESYFGGAPTSTFNVTQIGGPTPPATPRTPAPVTTFSVGSNNYEVKPSQNLNQRFLLYYSMLLFFQNGGGPCYVVSVGSTDTDTIDGAALMAFRIRSAQGGPRWAGGTLRGSDGHTQILRPGDIEFTARRLWTSPRTGITYPVEWRVRAGSG